MKPSHTLSGRNILVVEDDEWFAGHLARALESVGTKVQVVSSLEAVKSLIARKYSANAAVVDLMVKRSKGGRPEPLVGVEVAMRLRAFLPKLPILTMSAALSSKDSEIVAKYSSAFVTKTEIGFGREGQFLERLTSLVLGKNSRKPRIFIVHGHDHSAVKSLCKFLKSAFGFSDFVVLKKLPGGGKTIIEKFESYATGCDIVFVILTPDDVAFSKVSPRKKEGRARQNVIFELGFFYGKLHRDQGAVILLKKNDTAIPSDLQGVEYIDISKGISDASEAIRDQIKQIKWL